MLYTAAFWFDSRDAARHRGLADNDVDGQVNASEAANYARSWESLWTLVTVAWTAWDGERPGAGAPNITILGLEGFVNGSDPVVVHVNTHLTINSTANARHTLDVDPFPSWSESLPLRWELTVQVPDGWSISTADGYHEFNVTGREVRQLTATFMAGRASLTVVEPQSQMAVLAVAGGILVTGASAVAIGFYLRGRPARDPVGQFGGAPRHDDAGIGQEPGSLPATRDGQKGRQAPVQEPPK